MGGWYDCSNRENQHGLADPAGRVHRRRPDAAIRRRTAQRPAVLEGARHAVAGARQRGAVPHQLRRAASRPGMADRPRRRAGPDALVHRDPEHVRQRPVVLAVRHAGLSHAGDDPRQRAGAAPAAAGTVRRGPPGLRLRLVDGRAAGLSLGGAVPRCGGPHRGELRRGAHRGAQPGVPARADGGAGGRAGAHRQRPLHPGTARRQARLRPHLRRLGAQPGFLSRQSASGIRTATQSRRARSRHFPAHRLGGSRSAPVPPPTCTRSCAPGMRRISAPMRCTTATCRTRCGRSGPACC